MNLCRKIAKSALIGIYTLTKNKIVLYIFLLINIEKFKYASILLQGFYSGSQCLRS